MMKQEIILNELAKLLEIDRHYLTMDFRLRGYIHWDSLAIVSMIGIIDEQFGILLQGQAIEECETVKDIFILINHKQKETVMSLDKNNENII